MRKRFFLVLIFFCLTGHAQTQVDTSPKNTNPAKTTQSDKMDPNLLNILLGVFSGIVTYFLIEGCMIFYKKGFVPWLENRLYSEIDLTDTWIEKYIPLDPNEKEDKQEQTISLELKQKANAISGIAILTDNNFTEIPVGTRKMKIIGKIRNRHVTLHLELDNPKKFGLVNYLLEVTSEGDEMKGFTSYYNPITKSISTAECVLQRQPNNI